jgi:hypothetical protein
MPLLTFAERCLDRGHAPWKHCPDSHAAAPGMGYCPHGRDAAIDQVRTKILPFGLSLSKAMNPFTIRQAQRERIHEGFAPDQ